MIWKDDISTGGGMPTVQVERVQSKMEGRHLFDGGLHMETKLKLNQAQSFIHPLTVHEASVRNVNSNQASLTMFFTPLE